MGVPELKLFLLKPTEGVGVEAGLDKEQSPGETLLLWGVSNWVDSWYEES